MKSYFNRYVATVLVVIGLFIGPAMAIAMDTMDTMEANPDGMLTGAKGHQAEGAVALTKGMGGQAILTLSDINVDKVPDGYVYLAKDGDHTKGVALGMLKQFTGTVSFDIPAGTDVDAYNSVVIWCEKYHVEIGRAHLPKKMM
jgi:hypothetical protein